MAKGFFDKLNEYAEKLVSKEEEKQKKGQSNKLFMYQIQYRKFKKFIDKIHNDSLVSQQDQPKILSSVPYGNLDDLKK